MSKRISILITALLLAAPAAGATVAEAKIGLAPARSFAPHQVLVKFEGERFGRALSLPEGVGVREATAVLRSNPRVVYATPNYIATASASEATVPNDPGTLAPGGVPGGWVLKQWNFLPWQGPATPLLPTSPGGIDAVGAWRHLEAAGRPGARGVTIAVLDTGVAYRARGSEFRRSPDFAPGQFVAGYDFISKDRFPLDLNGHGTHIAGTIGERTNNGIGLTGLAYEAKLMPIRVLNRFGEGDGNTIAKGVRFAVAHGADVINMSFNFQCGDEAPPLDEALRRAYRRGVVTVAAIGNRRSEDCVAPPATGPQVIGVGGSTQGGCLGNYSVLPGKGVDLLGPGGGKGAAGCPSVLSEPIYQVTFLTRTDTKHFGEPTNYGGTSMAAAHVSAVAAMVIASGVLGEDPTPAMVFRRLRNTARDLGLRPRKQGAGLIDAARATEPPPPPTNPPKAAAPVAGAGNHG
jgi:serine protease